MIKALACKQCHHAPSGRFDGQGRQCHCDCHDRADVAERLLTEVLSAVKFANLADLVHKLDGLSDVLNGVIFALEHREGRNQPSDE